MPITLSTVRDVAVTAGALALAAMAAADAHYRATVPTSRDRDRSPALPDPAHGWLCQIDGAGEGRRIRPATRREAAAATDSQHAGDGGWFGLTVDGDIVPVTDPLWRRAGRLYGPDSIDAVYVTRGGQSPAPPTEAPPVAPVATPVDDLLAEVDALTGRTPAVPDVLH